MSEPTQTPAQDSVPSCVFLVVYPEGGLAATYLDDEELARGKARALGGVYVRMYVKPENNFLNKD